MNALIRFQQLKTDNAECIHETLNSIFFGFKDEDIFAVGKGWLFLSAYCLLTTLTA